MRSQQSGVPVQVLERSPAQDPKLRAPACALASSRDATLDRDVGELSRAIALRRRSCRRLQDLGVKGLADFAVLERVDELLELRRDGAVKPGRRGVDRL